MSGYLAKALQTPLVGPSGLSFEILEATQQFLNAEVPHAEEEGLNVDGLYNRRRGTIHLLYEGREPQAVARTFVHECLHDVAYAAGEMDNERLVQNLTDIVFDVLTGSPEFVQWCLFGGSSPPWGIRVKVSGSVWTVFRSDDDEIYVEHGLQHLLVPRATGGLGSRAVVWEALLHALYECHRARQMDFADTRSAIAIHIANLLVTNAPLWHAVLDAHGVVLEPHTARVKSATPPPMAAPEVMGSAEPSEFVLYRQNNVYVLERTSAGRSLAPDAFEEGREIAMQFEPAVWEAYRALIFHSDAELDFVRRSMTRFTADDVRARGWWTKTTEG